MCVYVVCVVLYVYTHMLQHTCGSQRASGSSQSSPSTVCPGDRTQVVRLRGKHLYLLSLPTGPAFDFSVCYSSIPRSRSSFLV